MQIHLLFSVLFLDFTRKIMAQLFSLCVTNVNMLTNLQLMHLLRFVVIAFFRTWQISDEEKKNQSGDLISVMEISL